MITKRVMKNQPGLNTVRVPLSTLLYRRNDLFEDKSLQNKNCICGHFPFIFSLNIFLEI